MTSVLITPDGRTVEAEAAHGVPPPLHPAALLRLPGSCPLVFARGRIADVVPAAGCWSCKNSDARLMFQALPSLMHMSLLVQAP
jgi:hypothetical protein